VYVVHNNKRDMKGPPNFIFHSPTFEAYHGWMTPLVSDCVGAHVYVTAHNTASRQTDSARVTRRVARRRVDGEHARRLWQQNK
jgi:hypothetical protein